MKKNQFVQLLYALQKLEIQQYFNLSLDINQYRSYTKLSDHLDITLHAQSK